MYNVSDHRQTINVAQKIGLVYFVGQELNLHLTAVSNWAQLHCLRKRNYINPI